MATEIPPPSTPPCPRCRSPLTESELESSWVQKVYVCPVDKVKVRRKTLVGKVAGVGPLFVGAIVMAARLTGDGE